MFPQIDIIILAAGKSERMGESNKLLLPFQGKPILQRVLNHVARLPFDQRIVVTGFQHELIEPLIDYAMLSYVYNPNFEDGMTSSIQTGIKSLSKESIGVMIIPGDLPNIDSANLERLTNTFLECLKTNPKTIVVATEKGVQKNPVIFSAFYYPEILAHKSKNGCKEIIQNHTKNVTSVEITAEGFFRDIDTPADYQKIVDETTE
jgi:molybdenum cofactor cytidylyltransferase